MNIINFSKIKRYGMFGITCLFVLSAITLIYGVKTEIDHDNAQKTSIVHELKASSFDFNRDYNLLM